MWRIKSSLMSSTTVNTINNNDPPASNRRDPDEDGAAVVMDRPLFYSNVTATAEDPSSDEEGLTVVPAAEDEENKVKDNLSELSLSPNQFTDSLLEVMNKFEEKEAGDDFFSTEEILPTEKMALLKKLAVKPDPHSVEGEDEDEGVLVGELTKEEEEILATLHVEPISSDIKSRKTVDAANFIPPDDKQDTKPPAPQKEIKETELTIPSLEITTTLAKEDEKNIVDQLKDGEQEDKSKKNMYLPKPNEELEEAMMPVWRCFTIALGVAAFSVLALGSLEKGFSPSEGVGPGFVSHIPQDFISDVAKAVPAPAPTPIKVSAPLSVPLFLEKTNTTAPYDITEPIKAEQKTRNENEADKESSPANSTWSGKNEMLYATSLLVVYYLACFWIRLTSTDRREKKKDNQVFFKNESASLNSFYGMLSFQKSFVKSGKGRRVGQIGKFDSSSYDKLTRAELLAILDGFGRYKGRDASKLTLIYDLCTRYEETLFRFSNPQVLQILQAKGYSVDTTCTKRELVALAVKIGF